jgi:hypothetical protein
LAPNYTREPYLEDQYKNRQFAPSENYFAPLAEPSKTFVPLQTNNLKVSNKLNDSRFGSFDDLEGKGGIGGINEPKGSNEIWAGLVSYSTSF